MSSLSAGKCVEGEDQQGDKIELDGVILNSL